MDFLDVFALIVLAILIAAVIWLVVLLGTWPGNLAKKRDHPQAEAIQVLGWIGVITFGVSWFIAIVWAYTKPAGTHSVELDARVKALETQLERLQTGGGAS